MQELLYLSKNDAPSDWRPTSVWGIESHTITLSHAQSQTLI